jgi:hypothetical protein
MKYHNLFVLLIVNISMFSTTHAQVHRVWIKAPSVQNLVVLPGTANTNPAMFEVESRSYTGTSFPFGTRVPIMRISSLYDLGNAVSTPPDKDVLMIMHPNGYLGLGTAKPTSLLNLTVSGNKVRQLLTFSSIGDNNVKWDYSSFGMEGGATFWVNNAQLRKGAGGSDRWFVDRGSFNASASRIMHAWDGIYFHYYNHDSNTQGAQFHNWRPFTSVWRQSMQITNSGQIRIGEKKVTTGDHTDYKLSVDGKVVAKRLIVTDGPEWADYVFGKDYFLMPLDSLDDYIKNNNHLPNIPSKDRVAVNGIDVYEMNVKLLEKIEELTLYILDLEKRVKVLETNLTIECDD